MGYGSEPALRTIRRNHPRDSPAPHKSGIPETVMH